MRCGSRYLCGMVKYGLPVWVCWLLGCSLGVAQSSDQTLVPLPIDTLQQLPTFELTLNRRLWGPYSPRIYSGSASDMRTYEPTLAQSFAQIALPFRNYGPATLATTTVRGANAAHTTVRWNGLTLNSPLNGTVDFNLLPPFLFGGATLQTVGAERGVLPLDGLVATVDLRPPKSVLHAEQVLGSFEIASFNNQRTQFGYARDASKHQLELRAVHHTGRNDYPRPPAGERTPNAVAQTSGMTASWTVASNHWRLRTDGWLQYAEREIPPSITQSNDHARQRDRFRRLSVVATKHHRSFGHRTLELRYGLSDEALWFESKVVPLAFSSSLRQQFEAQYDGWQRLDASLSIAAGALLDRGFTENIDGVRRRQVYHLRARYHRTFDDAERWQFHAFARQGYTPETTVPLTFGAKQRFRATARHSFQISGRRSFNLPNLNDLYWTDAFALGNPDLRAERGWNVEVGHDFTLRSTYQLQLASRLFRQSTRQRIVWLPNELGVYQPQNFRSVRSQGVEASGRWRSANARWHVRTTYRLTRATIQRIERGQPGNLLGRQLPYVPVHTAAATVRYQTDRWRVEWQPQFVGRRPTLFSDRNVLPAYPLTDLSLEWNYRSQYFVTGGVNNLFDRVYEGIAARPLPGRGYFLRLAVNFSRTLAE